MNSLRSLFQSYVGNASVVIVSHVNESMNSRLYPREGMRQGWDATTAFIYKHK